MTTPEPVCPLCRKAYPWGDVAAIVEPGTHPCFDCVAAERRRIMVEFDVDAAQREFPDLPRAAIIGGLHKARYHATNIPEALRRASEAWLRARGLHDLGGTELPPPGSPLPPGPTLH